MKTINNDDKTKTKPLRPSNKIKNASLSGALIDTSHWERQENTK